VYTRRVLTLPFSSDNILSPSKSLHFCVLYWLDFSDSPPLLAGPFLRISPPTGWTFFADFFLTGWTFLGVFSPY
jgi:hypothetical protein